MGRRGRGAAWGREEGGSEEEKDIEQRTMTRHLGRILRASCLLRWYIEDVKAIKSLRAFKDQSFFPGVDSNSIKVDFGVRFVSMGFRRWVWRLGGGVRLRWWC